MVLESDNNSDILIDDKRMVPEGKDFKIVFISSESKSGSELNSSMECDPGRETFLWVKLWDQVNFVGVQLYLGVFYRIL